MGIKHVVFVAPRLPEMSGGSTAIINLSRILARHGLQVEHISVKPGTQRPEFHTHALLPHPQWHNGPVFRGAGRLWRRLPLVLAKRIELARARAWLRRRLGACGSDTAIVYTHVLAKRFADEAGVAHRQGKALVIGQHHSQFESIDFEPGLADLIMTHYQDVDAFTALTTEDADEFRSLVRAPCLAAPNPYSAPASHPAPRSNVMVTVSRLSAEKQIDLVVRAFADATRGENEPGWTLEIYGDGDEHDAIAAAVLDTGCSDRVTLRGPTTDPSAVFARSRLNILASRYEGFGMTILEAASCGTPTMAFNCSPGVRSLITSPDEGFLVEDRTEAGLSAALRAVMSKPEELDRIGGNARRTIPPRFSPERITQDWFRIFSAAQAEKLARVRP
ncbi:glycosyltransferase [Acidipropionibacterium timonense]|uniref:glycosyltransferase n=1 Tax=Acidipropionibacterium timonense TaxID=2161818 RepID=UPI001436A9FA|nr:glycosyltransferase [Acidipropionibacterium timonense]